ncbi:MAG: cation:proton antiporter subunit C [Syntrophobacteraceae bacterium]
MEELLTQLSTKYNYWAYIAIMAIGLYAMTAKNNLVKKMIGLGIFQTSIMLFYVAIGSKEGATIPIMVKSAGEGISPADYINPLPHVLMLTAIVVSVATLGVALALIQRIYQYYGTLEENEIIDKIRNAQT